MHSIVMKYSHLIISGVPKSFDLWESIGSLQPCYEGMNVWMTSCMMLTL